MQSGQWAGEPEINAAVQVVQCSITIHKPDGPDYVSLYVSPVDGEPPPRMLHLAYHSRVHYNSVRMMGDAGKGPPALVVPHGQHPAGGLRVSGHAFVSRKLSPAYRLHRSVNPGVSLYIDLHHQRFDSSDHTVFATRSRVLHSIILDRKGHAKPTPFWRPVT